MPGQPTFQGSRDPGTDSQYIIGITSAYFPVLGNGDMFYVDETVYGYPAAQCRSMVQHVVDFGGELEFWSVKTDGNSMPVNSVFSVQINAVDTALVVVAESEASGKYESTVDPVTFSSGDIIVGYATAPTTAPGGGTPSLLQCYVQMTPDSGEHTIYKSTNGLFFSYASGGTAQIPLSGSIAHYNTQRSANYPAESLDFVEGTQMRVRSTGTLGYLQAQLELVNPTDIVLVYLQKNGEPADENTPVLVCTYGADYWGYYTDTTHTMAVEPGDLVNIGATNAAVGGATSIWTVGCNFTGVAGNTGIDVMCYEGWTLSGDYTDTASRALDYDYWDYLPTRPDTDASENVYTGKTIWRKSVLGASIPELTPHDMPESAGEWSREYLALLISKHQIEPTFKFTVRSLRVYMDLNTSGCPISVFVSKNDTGYQSSGGLFVECEDPGWYENSADSLEFEAYDTSIQPNFGTGLCFTIIPANYTPVYNEFGQRDQYDYTTAAIAHIASIGFSYSAESNDRECLVRVLPDATAVEPLPTMTRLARSIKITRPDGVVRAYTEHDEDIVHDGVTYKAIGGGMKATANELGAQLGDVGNIEIAGYSVAGGIEIDDLFGGAYDSAETEVWLLPWGPDNDQAARRIGGGVLGRNRQADDTFSIEALSWSSYLAQRSLLEIVTPTCRYELGETRCGVVLPCLTVTGSVTIATDDTSALGQRRKFQDILRTEDAGRFSEGIVTFSTGPNAGHSRKIKLHEALGIFTLWDPFVYPIGVGDDYSMSPGCDKKAETCRTKFENFVNFGGFPTVPGNDAASETPSGKMGQ